MKNLLVLVVLWSTAVLASPVQTAEKHDQLHASDVGSSNEAGRIQTLPTTVEGTTDSDVSPELPHDVLLTIHRFSSVITALRLQATCKWMHETVAKDARLKPGLQLGIENHKHELAKLIKIGAYDVNVWVDRLLPELLRPKSPLSKIYFKTFDAAADYKILRKVVEQAREGPRWSFEFLLKAKLGDLAPHELEPGENIRIQEIVSNALSEAQDSAVKDIRYHKRFEELAMDRTVAFLLNPDNADNLETFETAISNIDNDIGYIVAVLQHGVDHAPFGQYFGKRRAIKEWKVNAMGSTFRQTLKHILEARMKFSMKNSDPNQIDIFMIKKLVPKLKMDQREIQKVFRQARQMSNLRLAVHFQLAPLVQILLELHNSFHPVIFNAIVFNAITVFKAGRLPDWDIIAMLLEHSSYANVSKDNFEKLLASVFQYMAAVDLDLKKPEAKYRSEGLKKIIPLLLKHNHAAGPIVDKYYTEAMKSENGRFIQALWNTVRI